MKKYMYTLALMVACLPAFSQLRRIVVIGSSTSEGSAATTLDSSYVRRLSHYYKNDQGMIDTIYNLAKGGTTTYHGMPSSSTYWQDEGKNRPQPDPTRNVTRAVNLLRDLPIPANGVIIVNFPTNEFLSYDTKHIMQTFRTIYDSATALGNRCYITTTQPRNDGDYGTHWGRLKLAEIKDSILEQFGPAHALNFWDGMYNTADTTIKTEYRGDQIHFNNRGHDTLFHRVVAKAIFLEGGSLPMVWGHFNTIINESQVQLQWSTLQEQNTASFIVEHSTNGKDYKPIAVMPAKGHSTTVTNYSYTHRQPNTDGYNFYRIKEMDADDKSNLSVVRTVQFKDQKGIAVRFSPNPVQHILQVEVQSTNISLVMTDAVGRIVKKMTLQPGLHPVDLQGLAAGVYHMVIHKKGKFMETHDILKL